MRTLTLGKYEGGTIFDEPPRITCDSQILRHHINSPWFIDYLSGEIGQPLTADSTYVGTAAEWPSELAAKHTALSGSTGSGKSVALGEIIRQQLEAGLSAVIFEPKMDRAERYVQLARSAGFAPEAVALISPRVDQVPGWNPFLTNGPITQIAADLTSVIENITSSNAPRMGNILANAGLVVAAHKLSVFELMRLLQRQDYRDRLLSQPLPVGTTADDAFAYEEARNFFVVDFDNWSAGERASAIAPLNTRLQELLRSRFLASVLLARQNTVDLADLWLKPQLLVVHTDEATIGPIGARLLSSILARTLFRTAMRVTGPVRVLMAPDEIATTENLIGDVIIEALAIARSRGLQIACATQFIRQLSEPLRLALSQCAVTIRFRCGPDDAAAASSALASDSQPIVTRLTVAEKTTKKYERPPIAERSHTLLTRTGEPLRASARDWPLIEHESLLAEDPVETLCQIAHETGIGELYVRNPTSGKLTQLRSYAACIQRGELVLRGPSPLRLVIQFPRPTITKVALLSMAELQNTWFKIITNLLPRRCILKIPGAPARIVEVTYVKEPLFSANDRLYLESAQRATAQSPGEIEAMIRWRRDNIEADQHVHKKEAYPNDESIF